MPNKPTLKTIAKLSGMAVPTVSRALSGAADISSATKARIRRIAQEIGYVPDRTGLRLKTGRTHVISLLVPTQHETINPVATIISSVASGLRGTPFHLVVTPFSSHEPLLSPIKYILETGSADALIINETKVADERVRYLLDRGFPFVTHGRSKWADQHPYFDFDNSKFAQAAVEKLVERGRRNLLLIAPPFALHYAQDMIRGAKASAEACKVKLRVAEITSHDNQSDVRAYVREYAREHIGKHASASALDGVIVGSPNAAMAAILGLEDAGLRLGDRIDVFAKEIRPFMQMFRQEALSMQEDFAQAGDFIAKAAMQKVLQPKLPLMQRLVSP